MFNVPSVGRLTSTVASLCLIWTGTLLADVTITSGTVLGGLNSRSYGSNTISIQGANFSLNCPGLLGPTFGVQGNTNSITFYPALTLQNNCDGSLTYNAARYSYLGLNLTFSARPATVPDRNGGAIPGSSTGSVANVVFSLAGTVTTFSDASYTTVTNTIPVSGSGIFNGGAVVGFAFLQGSTGSGTYRFMPLPAFVQDNAAQGNWGASYGGDGFQIAGGMSQSSPYSTVSLPGTSAYTWASSTQDPRALNNGANATSRIASTYVGNYGSDFDIYLALTGGPERVALYLLDWESSGRVEQITINDAVTNALIDNETFSDFQNGQYAVWTLSGNVVIHVKRISGGSAAVSGMFFGPSGSAAGTQTAPSISNVQTSGVTSTSATVSWRTDQPTTGQVNYGTTAAFGGIATEISSFPSTTHSATLSGLTPGTIYNFQVACANAQGVTATSTGSTFTTGQLNAPAPKVGYVAFWGVGNSGVTISWSTDVPSDTQVGYGTSPALGQLSPLQPQLVAGHGVVLGGLASGTTYYFVAQSTASGSTGYSQTYSFTTTGAAPVPTPKISNVVANPSGNSATIAWTTDQPSASQVSYGATTAYGNLSPLDNALVTSHSVTITGLQPGTQYNFAVSSANSAGTSSSGNYVFQTSGSAASPLIGNVTTSAISANSVVIAWNTDQTGTSQVYFGTTPAYGQTSPVNTSLATAHSVTLTGLTPSTLYNFAVVSANAAGASAQSGNNTFSTSSAGGNAPKLGYLAFWGVTGSGVSISWSTDVPATTAIQYGTTSALGQSTVVQTALSASHGVTLSGLAPSTTYYFVAQSADISGNTGSSEMNSFTTLPGPPVISGITATPAANHTATISWSVSTPSNNYVEYGPSIGNYGAYSARTNLTTTPVCPLPYVASGLVHYRVVSVDGNGNQTTSPDQTFTEP